MNWTINQTVDLSRGYTPVVWPDALMVSGDVGAHTWRLTVLDNGVPADLSGATIKGSFLRPDGNTVTVAGSRSGNVAIVTLTDVCYAVEGKMKATIKMTKSGAVVTLAAVIFTVSLFASGSVIDPGVAYADFNIDASPKGVYANLAALNAGTPTAPDVTKIYITDDDKKWCYHNGTTWVAGGVYQAASVATEIELLENDLIELHNGYYPISKLGFANGSVADGVWIPMSVDPNLSKRVGTPAPQKFDFNITIYVDSGFRIGIVRYSDDEGTVVVSDNGWKTTPQVITAGTTFRFTISRGTEITEVASLPLFLSKCHISAPVPYLDYRPIRIDEAIDTYKGHITVPPSPRDVEPTRATTGLLTVKHHSFSLTPPSGYRLGYFISDGLGDWIDTGWQSSTYEISGPASLYINFSREDEGTISDVDFALFNQTLIQPQTAPLRTNETLLANLGVEFGRTNGASYVFVRIPRIASDGRVITPRVRLTSLDGTVSGTKRTAKEYALTNDSFFTINAGLFIVAPGIPQGQTIIDGVSITNTPMADDNGVPISATQCYPLCINASGILSADYPRSVDTAELLAAGIVQCVTGWIKLVDNFEICEDEIASEIVHAGKYIQQSIGQYQNGDYCVCTVDQSRGSVYNEAGLTYTEVAQLYVDRGVKFAYELDGGGSAQTVMGQRFLNPIYEGASGRQIPTVIDFTAV